MTNTTAITTNIWLCLGAIGSFSVSALHVYVIAKGAEAYRYFGAGEDFARGAEAGAWFPALATSGIVVIFAVLGVYALAGAGILRGLSQIQFPQMRLVILGTGIVYTLRGLLLFAELAMSLNIFSWRDGVRSQDPYFSAVSLALGIVHLVGWRMLK